MAEYVFRLPTEAIVESIASKNAARLAAMESAHDNVSRELEQLHQDAHQARQSEITMESWNSSAARRPSAAAGHEASERSLRVLIDLRQEGRE